MIIRFTEGRVFRSLLLEQKEIQNAVAQRIFPLALPQKTQYPAITYNHQLKRSATKETSSPDTGMVKIFIYSNSYEELTRIAEAAVQALDRKSHENICNISFEGADFGATELEQVLVVELVFLVQVSRDV